MKKLILVGVLAALGCGDGNKNGPCMAGATECVNDMVARACASDGTWVAAPCQPGSTCMAGSCVAKQDVACKPTDSTCMDGTHALVCNSNGVGFMSVTCPAGTVCQGLGLCVGTCIVGSSKCVNPSTVATCMDGFTFVESLCMPGMTSCVPTSATGASVPTAGCMPMQCPALGAFACGDKNAGATNTDPNFASTCVSSPSGLHWQAEQCAIPGTCSPGMGCSPTCIPGAMRCAGGLNTQTCGSDGKWGAPSPCTATPTGAVQVCIPSSGRVTCGDPVCLGAAGACEPDGFHPCVAGKVAAAAMPCATGTCVANGTGSVGGYVPGNCVAQCAAGDQKCDGTANYQTCVNGRWSSTTAPCTANRCIQYSDPASNGPRTVCGVCAPGSHRCTDATGAPGGVTDIETCDATGQYGAHAACTVGQCQSTGLDAACIAACQPGAQVCVGAAPTAPSVPAHPGTLAVVTCNPNGTLPPAPAATDCSGATPPASCCPTGTSCRKGPNGQPVTSGNTPAACVQCVGPNVAGGNELGLVDTMCTDATHQEVCGSDNKWPATPTLCTTTCQPENPGGTCSTFCFGTPPFGCTASAFAAHGTSCTGVPCGGTPDCCAGFCSSSTGTPSPAVCQ